MLALVVATLLCAERVPLEEKVFKAAQVVEFTLTYAGKGKPAALGKVLFPPESTAPAPPLARSFTAASPCLPIARKKKTLKLLAFYDENGQPLVGVEQDRGEGTELDPRYFELVEAVLEAKRWRDERMRAVGEEQLWQAQKRALKSGNPYLQRLALHFLRAHGGAGVLDEAKPVEREKAAVPASFCVGRK